MNLAAVLALIVSLSHAADMPRPTPNEIVAKRFGDWRYTAIWISAPATTSTVK